MIKNNDQKPNKNSELKRWGKAGALMATGGVVVPAGGLLSMAIQQYTGDKVGKRRSFKRMTGAGFLGGALAGAGTYGAYRGGKAIINKLRGKKKNDNAQYSLFSNNSVASFGLGSYIKNRAKKDLQKVIDVGVNSQQTDDVVKRLLKSGEKAGKQRAKVYGRYARKVWNTSPKLRRNVKIAGVAGAGLVGLNALTGLKTVYNIGKGIKNKVIPKKQQNTEYNMKNIYSGLANFKKQITDEDRSRSVKYARRGAIGYGVLNTLANSPKVLNAPGTKVSKGLGLAVGLGLNSAVGYGGGKLLARLKRGSGSDKTVTPQEKRKGNLGRNLLRGAAIGAGGLGALTLTGAAINQKSIRSKVKDAKNTLGLSGKLTPDSIKKAKREAIKKWHPDGNPGIDKNLMVKANDALEKVQNKSPELNKLRKTRNIGVGVGVTGLGLGAAGIYGTRKKKDNAQYSLFNPYVVEFARNQQQEQPKKKSLLKKGLKYAAIGGVGLAGLSLGGKHLMKKRTKSLPAGFKTPPNPW